MHGVFFILTALCDEDFVRRIYKYNYIDLNRNGIPDAEGPVLAGI